MKKQLLKILFVAALSTAAAFAQFHPMHDGGGNPNGGSAPDTATQVERRVSFLKSLLTLTDAQVTQATTILTNSLTAQAAIRTNLDTLRTSLKDAVKSNSTATIDSLSAQIGTATGQITAIQAKADAAFYALLTADQKTKYDALGGGRGGDRP